MGEQPPEPENLRIPLLLRLTFADAIDPGRLRAGLAGLAEHRAVHAERLADYRALDRDLAAGGASEEQRPAGSRAERAARLTGDATYARLGRAFFTHSR